MASKSTIIPAAPGWKLLYIQTGSEPGDHAISDHEFETIVAWKVIENDDDPSDYLASYALPVLPYEPCSNSYLLIDPDGRIHDEGGSSFPNLEEAFRTHGR